LHSVNFDRALSPRERRVYKDRLSGRSGKENKDVADGSSTTKTSSIKAVPSDDERNRLRDRKRVFIAQRLLAVTRNFFLRVLLQKLLNN